MAICVTGSLLEASEDYIAHQCNCISISAAGIAASIFKCHPVANDYRRRHDAESHKRKCPGIDQLGTIRVHAVEDASYRGVINMMAQHYPGASQKNYRGKDLPKDRLCAFESCLDAIAGIDGITSVAFPHRIGCGLAGGRWSTYRRLLNTWADAHPDIRVVIYRLPDDSPGARKTKKRPRSQSRVTETLQVPGDPPQRGDHADPRSPPPSKKQKRRHSPKKGPLIIVTDDSA